MMLEHAEHRFELTVRATEPVRSDVIAYAGLLASKGYISRKRYVVYEDATSTLITVSGIACWPNCLSLAQRDRQVAELLNQLRHAHGAHDRISYGPATGTTDEQYAPGPPWTRLQLVCDCILGTSPLKTSDARIVARFIPPLGDDLANALWTWDVEYDSVYTCWLTGGAYARWAADELQNPRSKLNETGSVLAAKLSLAVGCPVEYIQSGRKS